MPLSPSVTLARAALATAVSCRRMVAPGDTPASELMEMLAIAGWAAAGAPVADAGSRLPPSGASASIRAAAVGRRLAFMGCHLRDSGDTKLRRRTGPPCRR